MFTTEVHQSYLTKKNTPTHIFPWLLMKARSYIHLVQTGEMRERNCLSNVWPVKGSFDGCVLVTGSFLLIQISTNVISCFSFYNFYALHYRCATRIHAICTFLPQPPLPSYWAVPGSEVVDAYRCCHTCTGIIK